MKKIIHFLIIIYCNNIISNYIEPRKDLEYYQITLFNYLYNIIDKKNLEKYKISDFTSKKSNTLNFFEAIGLFLYSLSDQKNDKYTLWSLERLYVLSSDAKLSELLLWNLACEYEKYKKFRIANELFYQFKKIFPGSDFYWNARYKEIINAYEFCQYEYYDIYDTEKTMKLAQEYIKDIYEADQEIKLDIIYILQDLSLRMIKKTIDIGFHYLQKYKYTYNSICILSTWERLEQLIIDINYFLNFNIYIIKNNIKQNIYNATLQEMQQQIESFLNNNDNINLPSGLNYQEEHKTIIEYINNNNKSLAKTLKEVYKKLNYCVEAYYEIK